MKTNNHGYRMLRYLVPMVIIMAILLSGCGGTSSSGSSSSLNQEPVSSSEPIVSYPTEPPSSDSEEISSSTSTGTSTPASTITPSYDMDSWEWKNYSFEGYTISLPSSCHLDEDKIMMKEGQLPESLFKATVYPAIIGRLQKDIISKYFSLEKVNDATYHISQVGGTPDKVTCVLSDDPILPEGTFYKFKDYLAFTYGAFIGGGGTRENLTKETVYIPENGKGMSIKFWAEEGSTEGKPFYERVVESIKPETK